MDILLKGCLRDSWMSGYIIALGGLTAEHMNFGDLIRRTFISVWNMVLPTGLWQESEEELMKKLSMALLSSAHYVNQRGPGKGLFPYPFSFPLLCWGLK